MRLATVIVDKRKLIFSCTRVPAVLPVLPELGQRLQRHHGVPAGLHRDPPGADPDGGGVHHLRYRPGDGVPTRGIAEDLAEQIGEIEGVSSASLGDSIGAEEDRGGRDTGGHRIVFQGRGRADLRDLCGEEDDQSALAAMEAIRELLAPMTFI